MNSILSRSLRDSTAIRALTLLGAGFAASAFATPAMAQDAPAAAPSAANAPAADDQVPPQDQSPGSNADIIVTGSITRNPASATASPVVSVTAADLQNRGVSTVADALQLLTANNAGTAPPSWSSFGFATGASAPSLRGLNDAYTLVLFNGMRTAVYPLGDDGYRNFVDINTIPSSVVERIDVLQDGASATYGSDAIAGVVNVIIKREITGLHLNGSAAISQRGDNGERKLSASAGYGKLDQQGFNVWINAEYQKSDPLFLRDRGYPFNSADQSRICGTAAQGCLANAIRNGIQSDGSFAGFQSSRVPFVRPYDAAGNPLGAYQLQNPAAGCGPINPYTFTAANRAASILAGTPIAGSTPNTVCQEDLVNEYTSYNSDITRKGLNGRATIKLGSFGEAYVMANYYNTSTRGNNAGPTALTGATANGGVVSTVSAIFLPVYVCPQGVGALVTTALTTNTLVGTGCNAANGTLNPNNPFAAQGSQARLLQLVDQTRSTNTDTKTYRVTAGINGTIGEGWNVALNGTTSSVILKTQNFGYVYLQGLMDAIAKGTYNFGNPAANTQAQTDGVFRPNRNRAISKLTQVQLSVDKDLFKLPGGDVNVAVTGQFRRESINQPSSNAPNNVNPNQRYYSINAVSVVGKRTVWSAGYEVTLPIFDMLKVKALGSYDHYSSGFSAFSPKFEAEFRPIEQLKLRGTYSKGFRAPSFSESFALPTTGFVGATINCAAATFAAFCAAHATNPAYYNQGYTYGLTSSGNPNLKPEKSQSFTAGVVINPIPTITITADFWQTKLKNVIIGATVTQAIINQYYTNGGVTTAPGITTTVGIVDPLNPAALPYLGTAAGSYKNADQLLARGIDLSASGRFPITNGITWRTAANASYLMRLEQTNDDGTVNRYDGSLGACGITSCSGAPRWRATWQNTLDFNGNGNVTLTASYTSGYSQVATDSGGIYGDCQASADAGQLVAYPNGDPVSCNTKRVLYFDGHAEVKVESRFTLYMDVKNLLDTKPTYDPNGGYGLYQFQPAWSDSLFIGRFFRVGAKVDF